MTDHLLPGVPSDQEPAVAGLFPLTPGGAESPDQVGCSWNRVPQGEDGRWVHLTELRRDGVTQRYVDGELIA